MSVPAWVKDAVFYQIFPDRFANGNPANDPANVLPWNARPTRWSFHGGDLTGVTNKLDYLQDLGINVIYFTPIFQSASNHRYNAIDYFKIDPRLGTLEDFQLLIKQAHARNIRVVLDGVFNHCGRGFFAFSDILENGEFSPYRNWFHVKRFPVDAYTAGDARDYLGWWEHKSMPKFNTDEPAVVNHILDVARYWIDQGIDGWRLDVPNEIDDDAFWAKFREVVRSGNPEAYLLGEIWEMVPRWVGEQTFDGLMNYPLRTGILELLKGIHGPSKLAHRVEEFIRCYPWQNTLAMYNQVGSHDTERIYTELNEDTRKAWLAHLLAFALPGAPAIYYGDEVAVPGGKDPDCRRTFPWDEADWNTELRDRLKQLISIYKEKPSLRVGEFKLIHADDEHHLLAFGRLNGDDKTMVIVNTGTSARTTHTPVQVLGWEDGHAAIDVLGGEVYPVSAGIVSVNVPSMDAVILE